MLKKWLLFIFLMLPVLLTAATVEIYHTSDIHGFYFPQQLNGKQKGGFALLQGYLNEQKKPYLLLDGGDFTSGTYEAKQTGGNLSILFMNELNYNAGTIGNHEIDFGKDNLLNNMHTAKFDLLAANMFDTNTGSLMKGVKSFKVYKINGKRIGIIGLAKAFSPNADGIRISEDKTALKKALTEIKQQKPDAIILLTHSSINDDKHEDNKSNYNLVKDLQGINVVLGGHAHKIFQNIYNDDGILFVESGTALTQLSHITLDFDDTTGKLKSAKSELVELTVDKYTPDPKITAFAEEHRDKKMDIVIGKSNELITHYAPKDGSFIDAPLSNLIADLMKNYTHAEIGMQNTGGTRENLFAGDVTNRTIYSILPFSNTVCNVQVTGKFIKKLLYRSLKEKRSLFEFSGLDIKYRYKHNRPELLSVKVNGKELEPYKTYTLAANEYIAGGGSEGFMFKKLKQKPVCYDKTLTDLLADYLKANPQGIENPANGRIIKVD